MKNTHSINATSTIQGGTADNVSNDVPRRIDIQTVPAELFEKDGERFMKFQFIPSPNRCERRIKFRSKQGIMSQENNNTSNREVWHQQTRKQE